MRNSKGNMQVSRAAVIGIGFCAALAANAEDGGNAQKAMAKAQFMLRQATSEKTALQQQVTDLQKQVDTLTKQLADTKSAAGAKQESLAQQMAGSNEKWRGANEKLSGDLQSTRDKLKESSQQSAQLQQQLQAQKDNFALCYGNNRKLYDINRELLSKYKDKGAMDALLQREPFTGVAAVEIENLIQDTQYRLDDLKLQEAQAPAGVENGVTQSQEHNSLSGGEATTAP